MIRDQFAKVLQVPVHMVVRKMSAVSLTAITREPSVASEPREMPSLSTWPMYTQSVELLQPVL